jgi:hypothetical protein
MSKTRKPPAPASKAAREKAEREAQHADAMIGVDNLLALEMAREKDLESYPIAWSIHEGEHFQYYSHWRRTLDEVIAEELDGWGPRDTWDRAIWHGRRLMAVIRPTPDGPRVTKIE